MIVNVWPLERMQICTILTKCATVHTYKEYVHAYVLCVLSCCHCCCHCCLSPSSPQRRGGEVDVSTDKRGLLWILDEESIFPGATDQSFLERLQIYHGGTLEDHHNSGWLSWGRGSTESCAILAICTYSMYYIRMYCIYVCTYVR